LHSNRLAASLGSDATSLHNIKRKQDVSTLELAVDNVNIQGLRKILPLATTHELSCEHPDADPIETPTPQQRKSSVATQELSCNARAQLHRQGSVAPPRLRCTAKAPLHRQTLPSHNLDHPTLAIQERESETRGVDLIHSLAGEDSWLDPISLEARPFGSIERCHG
jgi:hypothetical protein